MLPGRLNRYFGRLRRPPGSSPLPGWPGYKTPRSGDTIRRSPGPGRASPVPAATMDTFRAPYSGESFTAALPGSSPLPWPPPRSRRARHSLVPPEGRLSNDAAGFALRYGPHPRFPFHRAFDAGLRSRPFPDGTASLLPSLLAATRTGLPPASDDELTNTKKHHGATSRCHLLLCWAHEITSLNLWVWTGLAEQANQSCSP